MDKKNYIILSYEEYKHLLERDLELQLLEQAGVDNWQWYGEHRQALREGWPDFMEIDEIFDAIIENELIAKQESSNEWLFEDN